MKCIMFHVSFTLSLQLSDGEVRRLSEQLLQKNEVVQKLQKEKEHLVELSQVREQGC